MSLLRHFSVPSPFHVRSCSVPNFFCTFADDEEHHLANPLIPKTMKINWTAVIIDLLKLVIAAIGGGYTATVI